MEGEKKSNVGVMLGAGVLVLLALAYGLFKYAKKEDNSAVVNPQAQGTSEQGFTYRDGTYTSRGSYFSPGGEEFVNVTLVVKGDVVADATFTGESARPISINMQGVFAANFKPLVIGRKLDEVMLDKVAGSSLTPKGWNDAVTKIQAQAKV